MDQHVTFHKRSIPRGKFRYPKLSDPFNFESPLGVKTDKVADIARFPNTEDIGELMFAIHADQKRENRHGFLKILSIIKLLARQSVALRRHGNGNNTHFIYLLKCCKNGKTKK